MNRAGPRTAGLSKLNSPWYGVEMFGYFGKVRFPGGSWRHRKDMDMNYYCRPGKNNMRMISFVSAPCRGLLLPSLIGIAFAAAAETAGSTAVPLRQHIVHVAYNEGDFDKVLEEIESFTRANKTYERSDSIFIAKHLSVVYTANPDTREKGKYYMYRLLEMMPSAELVDMFVSDEIDRIFERVRREFLARQRAFGVDPSQIAMPGRPPRTDSSASASASGPSGAAPGASTVSSPAASPASATASQTLPDPKPPVPFWKRKGVWVAGGAGLAAAGALATYVHLNEEEAEARRIRLRGESGL